MFSVYHSNHLDVLKSLLAALIRRDPLADPFASELILVQSPGMAQWLKQQLAVEFGIESTCDETLRAEDFSKTADACLLGKAGRGRFYAAFETRAEFFRRQLAEGIDDVVQVLREQALKGQALKGQPEAA